MSESGALTLASLAQMLQTHPWNTRPARLNFEVKPQTEWLISVGYGRKGADLSPARDHQSYPEIPQASMRGLLRDAVESLASWYPVALGLLCGAGTGAADFCGTGSSDKACLACRTFGSPLRRGGWYVSAAGLSDLQRALYQQLDPPPHPRDSWDAPTRLALRESLFQRRMRVAMNAELGRADEHKLFDFETAVSDLRLHGFAEERPPLMPDVQTRAADIVALAVSLSLIERVGSHRRKGWGQVHVQSVVLTCDAEQAPNLPLTGPVLSSLAGELLDRPAAAVGARSEARP